MNRSVANCARACAAASASLALAACASTPAVLRVGVYAQMSQAPELPPPAAGATTRQSPIDPTKDLHCGPEWSAPENVAPIAIPDESPQISVHVALVHALARELTCVTLELNAPLPEKHGWHDWLDWQHWIGGPPADHDKSWKIFVPRLQADHLYVWSVGQFMNADHIAFDKCDVVTRVDIRCNESSACPRHIDVPLQLPDATALDIVSDCGATQR